MRTSKDQSNQKMSRSLRAGGYSIAAAGIVLIILLIINILTGMLPSKVRLVDVTANGFYSFSSQTRTLLKDLKAEVIIYHLSHGKESDVAVETLLEQYAGMSRNIRVIEKDPEAAPEFLEHYGLKSVDNHSLIVECGPRYRYLGKGELYEYDFSNYYATGVYETAFAGEQAITSAIDYCTAQDLPKVYLLGGHGEKEMLPMFQDAVKRENIELVPLNLLTVDAVPPDADAVILNAPQSDISAKERTMLQQYLQNGGNMLLLTDPPKAGAIQTNLQDMMSQYGVHVQEGIITEGSQNHFMWGMPQYLLPNLSDHMISNPLRKEGYYVLLPFAHGLQIDSDLPPALKVHRLLTTSGDAYTEGTDQKQEFTLSVAIEKVLEDDFASHITWIASGALLEEQASQQVAGGNEDFFLNALNWTCGLEGNKLTIHAKSMSGIHLTMNSLTATVLTVLVLTVPLIYLLTGVVVWYRRNRK